MKTTIISIISIITCLFSLQSCRDSEMENLEEIKIQKEEKIPTKFYMKTENDSLETTNNSVLNENIDQETDPPPKDRGQWKIVSP